MKYAPLAAIVLGAFLPVSAAFADTSRMGPTPPAGAEGTFNGAVRVQLPGSEAGAHVELHSSVQASGTPPVPQMRREGESASGTRSTNGEKAGVENRFGTTTPPGVMMHAEASTTGEGAVARPGNPVSFFLQWLFGLPASTTVGQVQNQLAASTSANVAASSSAPLSFGNFFAHFFANFFGGH